MDHLVCGLLDTSGADPRARDLTLAWLRWGYFGDVIADTRLERILAAALARGYRYCLVQGPGHIITEHASPHGRPSRHFFAALDDWIAGKSFVFAGKPGRCLLVDLHAWAERGRPPCDAALPFDAGIAPYLLDLAPDLSAARAFLADIEALCEKGRRGVFVLNYEPYDDVAQPPAGFTPPVSTLYCVAAGLKPNRILATHGFDPATRVLFFDYSDQALAFRRMLNTQWDGRDYPAFLRKVFARLPPATTHYYLWPGASADTMDWDAMERLWATELASWGGPDAFAEHWRGFAALRHDYLACNILAPAALLARIEDEPGAVIWWSNAFSTIYTATHHGLAAMQAIYEDWLARLAAKAPGLWLYGSDHTNMSVNAITAKAYREGYLARGGDPLLARTFHRRRIRF
jgi:hypothetical protein